MELFWHNDRRGKNAEVCFTWFQFTTHTSSQRSWEVSVTRLISALSFSVLIFLLLQFTCSAREVRLSVLAAFNPSFSFDFLPFYPRRTRRQRVQTTLPPQASKCLHVFLHLVYTVGHDNKLYIVRLLPLGGISAEVELHWVAIKRNKRRCQQNVS